jgi:hypothetical protein
MIVSLALGGPDVSGDTAGRASNVRVRRRQEATFAQAFSRALAAERPSLIVAVVRTSPPT